jgi:hypothetical protein
MAFREHQLRQERKSNRSNHRLSLEKLEDRLAFSIDAIEQNLALLTAPTASTSTPPDQPVVSNTTPTFASPPTLTGGNDVRGRSAVVSVRGADDQGEASLRYHWSVIRQPTANAIRFAANGVNHARNNTLTFARPGDYEIRVTIQDRSGLSATRNLSFRVLPTLTTLVARTSSGQTVSASAPLSTSDTTARFNVQGLDQFGGVMSSLPSIQWQTVSAPSGGSANVTSSNGSLVANFTRSGLYQLRAQVGTIRTELSINVAPALRSLELVTTGGGVVTSSQPLAFASSTERLTVRGVDQFNQPVTSLSNFILATTSAPTGAQVSSTLTSGVLSIRINEPGNYSFVATGGGRSVSFSATAESTFSSIRVVDANQRSISSTRASIVSASTLGLTALALDQFGRPLSEQPSFTWQISNQPEAGAASITATNNSVLATFTKAGSYVLSAQAGDLVFTAPLAITPSAQALALFKNSSEAINPSVPLTVTSSTLDITAQAIDQFGDSFSPASGIALSTISAPDGATARTSTRDGLITLAFSRPGQYRIGATSGSASIEFTVDVVPSVASFNIIHSSDRLLSSGSRLNVASTSQALSAIALDQFNQPLVVQPAINWEAVTVPEGGEASLSIASNTVTATFNRAGIYVLRVSSGTGVRDVTLNVLQRLTSLPFQPSTDPADETEVTSSPSISVTGNRIRLDMQALDQFGNPMASTPAFTVTTTSATPFTAGAPAGNASVRFETGAATFSFTRAGSYTVQLQAGSFSSTLDFNVTPTWTRTVAVGSDGRAVAETSSVTTSSQRLLALALDQFGQRLAVQPDFAWSTVATPDGASPTTTITGNQVDIQYDNPGTYTFKAVSGDVELTIVANVIQAAATLSVTPGSTALSVNATQRFQLSAQDQFGRPFTPTVVTWSATGGSIDSSGLYTAGTRSGTFTITAQVGNVRGTARVTIDASALTSQLRNQAIAALVQNYYGDGAIDRTEMINLLRSAGRDGIVDAAELTDFRFIVSANSPYVMPVHVRELARDVVNDNPANLRFQGRTAGNLIAGSPASLLNTLIDKWFLGADRPLISTNGVSYRVAQGNLFNATPSRNDARQGMLGDCYLIASLIAIADRNVDAIRDMFIDNGDNTFTVRFFAGTLGHHFVNGVHTAGFTTGVGVADYVTVDRQLPSFSNGTLAYSGMGQSIASSSTTLWIALAEKAYAQWNETRNSGRDGTNQYSSIEGGWMSNVNAQVLGYNSTNYSFSSTPKQTMISALSAGRAVTLGTKSTVNSGFVGGHAYVVTGYNAATDRFSVFNPWGSTHPEPLTWAQLQANCTMFVVTDTRGSNVTNTSTVRGGSGELLIGNWTTVVTPEVVSCADEDRANRQSGFYDELSDADSDSDTELNVNQSTFRTQTIIAFSSAYESDANDDVTELSDTLAYVQSLDMIMADLFTRSV